MTQDVENQLGQSSYMTEQFDDRRVVSILFADVVGSTKAISTLDPDDAREFLDGAIERMVQSVHAFGGSVARIQGDGIMAIFGAPHIQEDHATRSALAGMHLQQNSGSAGTANLSFRVGIHSGPVIVRWQTNDFGRELDSVGSVVHIAAHIEEACNPGRVAISETTFGLVTGDIKGRRLKADWAGHAAGYPDIWEVEELTQESVLSPTFFDNHLSTLVGRQKELTQIRGFVDAVLAGEGTSMGFVGEAGYGKSRLMYEASQLAVEQGVRLFEMRGSSIRSDTPFSPIAALLRTLGIQGDNISESSKTIANLNLTPIEILGIRSILQDVSGEEAWNMLPSDERQKSTISGTTRLIASILAADPSILLIEDLHFMDPESQLFIHSLKGRIAGETAGLIVSSRPESYQTLKAVSDELISLGPLEMSAALQLVNNEFGSLSRSGEEIELAKVTAAEIAHRAEGSPLALEEFLRTAFDSIRRGPFETQHLPVSLESLLQSRLSNLAPQALAIAEIASVLGPDSPIEIIRVIAKVEDDVFYESIYSLSENRILSITADGNARFSHQLLLDAGYNGMVRKKRQQLHAEALQVLSDTASGFSVPFQELARHAYASKNLELSLKYLWKACLAAIENAAIYSVVDLYRRVLAVCEEMGSDSNLQKAKFTLLVFDAFQQLGQQQELAAELSMATEVFSDLGQKLPFIQAKLHLATVNWILGRQQDALGHIQDCRHLPETKAAFPVQNYCEFTLANVEYASGDPIAAIARLKALAQLHVGDLETARFGAMISVPGVMIRAFLGWYMTDVGQYDEAETMFKRANALAEQMQHGYSRMMVALGYGYRLYRAGKKEAVEWLQVGHELCCSSSFFGLEPIGSGFLAAAHLWQGNLAEAEDVLNRSRTDGHYLRTKNAGNYYLLESRARLKMAHGDTGAALALADKAVTFTTDICDRVHQAYALVSRARLQLDAGSEETQIIRDLEFAERLAEHMDMLPLIAEIRRLRRI